MKRLIDRSEIERMEERKRAAFINCLSGVKSLNLVGTVDSEGQTNLAIFNSVFHLGAHPPLLGMISRPDSVHRGTLSNIRSEGFYTLNHVREDFFEKAHQTSARYAPEVSEFEATGLEADFLSGYKVPFVKDASIRMLMKFIRSELIPENGTYLVIGEIQTVEFPESALREDGTLDLVKAGSIGGVGLDSYLRVQEIARLSYAKPDRKPSRI